MMFEDEEADKPKSKLLRRSRASTVGKTSIAKPPALQKANSASKPRSKTIRRSVSSSSGSLGQTYSTLWGVMRVCSFQDVPVFGLFHQISVVALRTSQKDWEGCLIDALEILSGSGHVILVVMDAGSLQPEARVSLLSMLNKKFRRYGLHEVVLLVQENDIQMVYDIIRSHICSLVENIRHLQSREFPSQLCGLYEETRGSPLISVKRELLNKVDNLRMGDVINRYLKSPRGKKTTFRSHSLSIGPVLDPLFIEWAQIAGIYLNWLYFLCQS